MISEVVDTCLFGLLGEKGEIIGHGNGAREVLGMCCDVPDSSFEDLDFQLRERPKNFALRGRKESGIIIEKIRKRM
jgi:hypothetical protein